YIITSFTFNYTATREIYTLSLHDALPIFEADTLIGIDNFGTVYFIKKNTLYKIEDNKNYSYSNVQFGKITSANSFNPLKIPVFYEDFNAAYILDNRFAEILKIDFNTMEYYKNVSLLST